MISIDKKIEFGGSGVINDCIFNEKYGGAISSK